MLVFTVKIFLFNLWLHCKNPLQPKIIIEILTSESLRMWELRDGLLRTGQLRTGHLRAGHLRAGQLKAGQLRARQLRAGQLRPGQLRTWNLDARIAENVPFSICNSLGSARERVGKKRQTQLWSCLSSGLQTSLWVVELSKHYVGRGFCEIAIIAIFRGSFANQRRCWCIWSQPFH